MKQSRCSVNIMVTAMLLLTLATTIAWAQGPVGDPALPAAPAEAAASPLGTSITYQGQLKQGGNPVTGSCDLRFILYDAAVGGAQVGPIQEKAGVAISNGLFTVPDLDFGAGSFNGQARWLDVAVRCPSGSGGYTGLTPRQALTAAPYALYAAQTGVHNHLGQTWTGTNNPLAIGGAFNAAGNNAALLLSNSTGNGLQVVSAAAAGMRVSSAGGDGVYVDSAGQTGFGVARAAGMGVYVDSAGGSGLVVGTAGSDGVYVGKAGATSTSSPSDRNHGVEVAGAQGSGVFVGHADQDGVEISAAGQSGVSVNQAAAYGLVVNSAGWQGLYVNQAGSEGVRVRQAGEDGVLIQSAAKNGVGVDTATWSGFAVGQAGHNGLWVYEAEMDGVYIGQAGYPSSTTASPLSNGVEIAGAQGYGVYVGSAGADGVRVDHTSSNGVYVRTAGSPSTYSGLTFYNGFEVAGAQGHGLYVGRADHDGVNIQSTGESGVYVKQSKNGIYVDPANEIGVRADTLKTNNEWGLYTNDKIRGMNVTLSSVTLLARVGGPLPLELGDIVAVMGIGDPLAAGENPLALVTLAGNGSPGGIVGVVEGRMALVSDPAGPDGEDAAPAQVLRSVEGLARAGDLVAITVLGVARVKADPAGGAIEAGMRLTAAPGGRARALKTVVVQGVELAEGAPSIGIALGPAGDDGMGWVLVNPR